MKSKYPKLLSWIAKRARVEDDQAKLAWDYEKFRASIFLCADDHEFILEQFTARVKTIGFINAQLSRAFSFGNPGLI